MERIKRTNQNAVKQEGKKQRRKEVKDIDTAPPQSPELAPVDTPPAYTPTSPDYVPTSPSYTPDSGTAVGRVISLRGFLVVPSDAPATIDTRPEPDNPCYERNQRRQQKSRIDEVYRTNKSVNEDGTRVYWFSGGSEEAIPLETLYERLKPKHREWLAKCVRAIMDNNLLGVAASEMQERHNCCSFMVEPGDDAKSQAKVYFSFSWRAWGDLMAAIVNSWRRMRDEPCDPPRTYMDYGF